MHFTAAASLLVAASSVNALALERRAAPTESPGAVGFAWPPLRGWAQSTVGESPCGGSALGGRVDYPINGGDIALKLTRDVFNIQVSYANDENPTELSQFSPLVPAIEQSFSGSKCFKAPDLSTLGVAVGDKLTLNLNWVTGPKNSSGYQCADVTIVAAENFVAESQYTCANVTASTQTRSGSGKGSSSAEAAAATGRGSSSLSSSSNDDGLTSAQAGGVGAGVTAAVFLAVLALLYFAGFARFGSRSKVAAQSVEAVPGYSRADAGSMTSRGSMVKA
ncbi:hypothetical protein JCM8097_009184 [Rhodosporidiobolus ruineniae]